MFLGTGLKATRTPRFGLGIIASVALLAGEYIYELMGLLSVDGNAVHMRLSEIRAADKTTLTDIVHDPKCQIIIATNGLAQGNDIKVMKTVIQIGEPESAEIYVQKPGHARPCVQNPLAIFYISSNRMELAEKVVQQTDAENDADAKTAGSSVLRLNNGFTEDKQVVLQRVVILTEFYKMPTEHTKIPGGSDAQDAGKTWTGRPIVWRVGASSFVLRGHTIGSIRKNTRGS
ncbi:hypothetical protein B0H14DRAFT_3696441 [Mycena olivaceomarginata]|nr:hypothetical protein B0H14DRAFT_3696441 [Mycena olivaceomarginata]